MLLHYRTIFIHSYLRVAPGVLKGAPFPPPPPIRDPVRPVSRPSLSPSRAHVRTASDIIFVRETAANNFRTNRGRGGVPVGRRSGVRSKSKAALRSHEGRGIPERAAGNEKTSRQVRLPFNYAALRDRSLPALRTIKILLLCVQRTRRTRNTSRRRRSRCLVVVRRNNII